MIEEFCRNIYNIGLKLSCDLSSINCLCPDKDAYEYLCYQCYLRQKDISEDDYKLKFNAEFGKIVICHEFMEETFCTSADWVQQQIINVVVENVKDKVEETEKWNETDTTLGIELVALSMTRSAVRYRMIPYINMVNVFRTDQFVSHFWNLSIALFQHMQIDKDCTRLLNELYQCIDDANMIYKERKLIGKQFYCYLDLICMGLESTTHKLHMERAFLSQQSELISRKEEAKDLLEFIFCGVDTDGKIVENELKSEFISICSIMKKYITNYQEQKQVFDADAYEKLIIALDFFAKDEFDVNAVKELISLDLQATNSWKANAGILLRYLQTIRKRNLIEAYELAS